MKNIKKISGILVLVVAGLLLVTLAGCDHRRYNVHSRRDYCAPPVRYSEYHYVAPPRTYDRPLVVVRDSDRTYDRHDKDRHDRHDRDDRKSYDRHDRHDRRR